MPKKSKKKPIERAVLKPEDVTFEYDEVHGADAPKRNLDVRNAYDESIAKIQAVLGLITSFAKEENFTDVQNACWLISDEIERLDEKLVDLGC